MGAQTELWTMYQSESDRELRKAIIQALVVGGGQDRIQELARAEKDPELRRDAIHKLGLMGPRTSDAILAIYRSDNDREVRATALHALFLQGNAHALVEIARTEKDPELKKQAVTHLTHMNSKEGTEFLLELLKK
jgi:HEAT repeat protein